MAIIKLSTPTSLTSSKFGISNAKQTKNQLDIAAVI